MGLDMYLYRKTTDEVAYWRKANAIHGWFIRNAEAVDNCTPIHVSIGDLVVLRDDVQKVLDEGTLEAVMEYLPPTGGFFFGGTEVDEYYWMNLKDTLTKLNDIIEESSDDTEFEYQASW
jgi:hypothetical protein